MQHVSNEILAYLLFKGLKKTAHRHKNVRIGALKLKIPVISHMTQQFRFLVLHKGLTGGISAEKTRPERFIEKNTPRKFTQ
jgi:hypothetical protein